MKTTFLIDGFNLYHSIVDIEHRYGTKYKWLDIHSLCRSYLSLISNDAELGSIYYFTALRLHLSSQNPDTIIRHKTYISILKSLGIKVELGKFKRKSVRCKLCNRDCTKYEEKQTDIAIISKLWELVVDDQNDAYVIVTGDTDIIPGIKTIKHKFPRIKLYSLFPFGRKNDELIGLIDGYFKITKANLSYHQLDNPFILPNGRVIPKPIVW